MLAPSIKWILVISGIVAAGGGLAALLAPQTTLKLVFGADNASSTLTEFFVRHWGALLFVVCSLTIYAAYFPETRGPILAAAIFEKAIISFLIFFGSSARTGMMTAIAIMDGSLAVLFTAYLLGL